MSRIRLPKGTIVLALAALVWTTGLASAQNPHFIKASASLDNAGDLVCSFKEAGLGDTETTYTCQADAAVTCTCVTNSGKCPAAANLRWRANAEALSRYVHQHCPGGRDPYRVRERLADAAVSDVLYLSIEGRRRRTSLVNATTSLVVALT